MAWSHQSTEAQPVEVAAPYFADLGRQETPLSLTTADGTGLKLVRLHSKAVLEGPLAYTELHLTFENPQDRVLEGRFQITLPEKAAISRFAMRIGENWQEAEVVERQAARRAYEDFLHRKQDPALLEKEAGNEFRARIFPIPAKGQKKLIISYSQELVDSQQAYVLPLHGLPKIQQLELEVWSKALGQNGKTPGKFTASYTDFLAKGDFCVPQFDRTQALKAEGLIVARVKPALAARSKSVEDLLILMDTSASRAIGLEVQNQMLTHLLSQFPEVSKVTVAGFDQELKPMFQGKATEYDGAKLLARGALGATDLSKALNWATQQKDHTRLVLVTDGMTTSGKPELAESLKESHLDRLDVILVGGIKDREKMSALVDTALKTEGVVLDGTLPVAEIAERLRLSVTSGLDVEIPGAEWVWPSTFDNIQPGDERLVYAKLSQPTDEFQVKVGSQVIDFTPRPLDSAPLLERSSVVARIARLESLRSEATSPEQKKELDEQIVTLSTKHRVLSDKTALLVLETEEDYARFQIDRKALSNILVIGKDGLAIQTRQEIQLAEQAKKDQQDLKKKSVEMGLSRFVGDTETDDRVDTEEEVTEDIGTVGSGQAGGGERSDSPVPVAAPAPAAPPRPPSVSASASAAPDEDESEEDVDSPEPPAARRPAPRPAASTVQQEPQPEAKVKEGPPAVTGKMAEIRDLLKKNKRIQALAKAQKWQKSEPGNVMALIALGDCYVALGRKVEAARVFGSILDLFASRADLRRYAGSRLQALGDEGLPLAIDSFEKAVEQRPDHVSSHRFLALALARNGDYPEAFSALEKGLAQKYPSGRFRSYERILKEDLGIIGAAWRKKAPELGEDIAKRLEAAKSELADDPSLRFILTWETDANDVDFHIYDNREGHAYYSTPKLPSGGELFGDVTTGYGPECFAIPGKPKAFPYRLQIHYYSRGPMGFGMGQLEILQHDGSGKLSFEERPYVVMNDGAYVDLGTVKRPLP